MSFYKQSSLLSVSDETLDDWEYSVFAQDWLSPSRIMQRAAEHEAWLHTWPGRLSRFRVWLDSQRPRIHRGSCPEAEDY